MKPNYYIASCSYGKDSIAQILIALENNEPLDEVIFCEVRFGFNISGEIPEHIDFINNVAKPALLKRGVKKITHITTGKTYIDCFMHYNRKREKIQGFPLAKKCKIKSELKIAPIKKYIRKLNKEYNVIEYIGITIDEPYRFNQLTENKVSLLKKYMINQIQTREICEKNNLLSPVYKFSLRQGCWFCPNAKISQLARIKRDYPFLWSKLKACSEVKGTISNKFSYNKTFADIERKVDIYNFYHKHERLLFCLEEE